MASIDPNVNTSLTTGDEEQINNETKPLEATEASRENEPTLIQSSNDSVAETWTIIDKEEIEDHSNAVRHEKKNSESSRESDSESIEVISEDEFLPFPATTSSNFSNDSFSIPSDSISFPSQSSPSTSSDSLSFPSLISQRSSVDSILSDGIPIADSDKHVQLEQEHPLYVWNNEQQVQLGMEIEQGEPEDNEEFGQEDEQVNPAPILVENDEEDPYLDEDFGFEPQNPDAILDNDPVQELDRGEPGYDLDDDGLPVAQLLPREQNGDLYPSQELDEGFPLIERGEVYKHSRNRSLNYLLSGMLVVVLAMVIGLGVGHFLGLTERMEVQEMYDIIQEEKLETITDELVDCITGEEGMGGDDQELDERVIRQLRDENEELRDQLQQLKSNVNGQGDEAMLVALKNRIKALMAANSDLEGEVASLKLRNVHQSDLSNKKVIEYVTPIPTMECENNPENDEDERVTEAQSSQESHWPDNNGEQVTEVQKPETKLGNIVNQETANLIIGLEKKWEEIKNQWVEIQKNALAPMINITKEIKRVIYKDWNSKRVEGREKWRVSNARADWLFERAKYRSDIRDEESKGDWYFENKYDYSMTQYQQNDQEKEQTCFKDFDDCQADDKGKANQYKKSKTKTRNEENKKGVKYSKNFKKGNGKKENNEEWDYKKRYKQERKENKKKYKQERKENKREARESKKDQKKYKKEANGNRREREAWDSKKYKKKYDKFEPRINMPEAYLHDYQERIKNWVQNF